MNSRQNHYQRYLILFFAAFCIGIYFIYADTTVFLRSYATDYFAVMYVYLFLRTLKISFMSSLATAFCISYAIEIVQLFKPFEGRENHFILIVMGGTFDFYDFLAYNLGLFTVVIFELFLNKKPSRAG